LYCIVDYSDEAKRLCVGGTDNLRIYFYSDNHELGEVRIYTESLYKKLIENQVNVVWRPKFGMPNECMKEPKRKILFGRVKMGGGGL